jgi:predicted dinucleotide-binding enzyme
MVDPAKLTAKTDVFISGDDADAKATVMALLRSFGWKSIIDLGDITTSRSVEGFVLLWQSLRHVVPSRQFNIKVVGTW